MQEENHSSQPPITSVVKQTQSTFIRDISIPVSIVIAGMFIGAGLYFSGGQVGNSAPVAAVNPEQQQADNTDKVKPVDDNDHIKGDVDAVVKIVEYSDFDCPFCSRFHDVMDQIIEQYPSTEVAWVYRHFPLEQLHPQAAAVAVASECVAEAGGNEAFWVFTDGYFAARGSGDATPHAELIPRLVTEAGVSEQVFTECFESDRYTSAVQEDMDNAVETGGRGTPWSIIIGPTGKTYPVNGALPKQTVEQLIEIAKQEA